MDYNQVLKMAGVETEGFYLDKMWFQKDEDSMLNEERIIKQLSAYSLAGIFYGNKEVLIIRTDRGYQVKEDSESIYFTRTMDDAIIVLRYFTKGLDGDIMTDDYIVRHIAEKPIQKKDINYFSLLPEKCYVTIPDTEEVTMVVRGETGHYPLEYKTNSTSRQLNEPLGVTPEQEEAMLAGSLFGWHVPAANPDMYKGETSS